MSIEELRNIVKEFPEAPGVYLMKNIKNKIIYVGKAKSLRSRVRSYFNRSKDQSPKTLYLVQQISTVEYLLTNTEVEAFLLEASLIKKHRPRYNIRLKDDKSYPYMRLSIQDRFPRFYLQRRVSNDGSFYFGPYTSGSAVREMIRFLNRTFQVRDCSDDFFSTRKRPCMTYQIGRCTAPCVGLITEEKYQRDIQGALNFLRDGNKKVIRDLTQQMKEASAVERFEAAARYRDSLKAIEAIWEKQSVVSSAHRDIDVIAFYGDERGTLIETLHVRSGRVIGNRSHFFPKLVVQAEGEDPREWMTSFINQYYADNIIPDELILSVQLGSDLEKLLGDVFWERAKKRPRLVHALDENEQKLMKMAENNAKSHFCDHITKKEDQDSALAEIQKKFSLPELPRRMECFDISHFQGTQTVASKVVFEDGQPRSDEYRKYKMKQVDGPNDYAAMKEVLSRRLNRSETDDPQLIVVDGGKGQLKIATEVLLEIGRVDIPVVAIAKSRVTGHFTDQEIEESQERFFIPGRQNPVLFRSGSLALKILVQLRDEAHRFAISYHRQLREKEAFFSSLDQVRGLGKKKKNYLFSQFSSLEEIRQTKAEDIAKLKGFNINLANDILAALIVKNEKF